MLIAINQLSQYLNTHTELSDRPTDMVEPTRICPSVLYY